jgi:hypothetical protein
MRPSGKSIGAASNVARALEEGARVSRTACATPARVPLRLILWQRHKWKIVGLALLLLTETVLFLLASTAGSHF